MIQKLHLLSTHYRAGLVRGCFFFYMCTHIQPSVKTFEETEFRDEMICARPRSLEMAEWVFESKCFWLFQANLPISSLDQLLACSLHCIWNISEEQIRFCFS